VNREERKKGKWKGRIGKKLQGRGNRREGRKRT